MKNVVRNGLFPTADMVISMSKEFGVPLTQEDFEGKIIEHGARVYISGVWFSEVFNIEISMSKGFCAP